MIVRATAHPAYLTAPPLLRPRAGLAPLVPGTAPATEENRQVSDHFGSGFNETGWIDLDDEADARDLGHEAAAADAALLRCVGCAAFATLVLALVSSLQLA